MIDRFDHVMIEPGVLRLATVFFLSPPGQGYKHNVLAPRLLADTTSRVEAVQVRQTDVQQHHVRPECCRRFHGSKPVVGYARLMACQLYQDGK